LVVTDRLRFRNGCLCCSVKDNGVKAIEKLMEKRGKFDYILLETTGLADPGPIAAVFWLDTDLGADVMLDGIVTVVDAKYAPKVCTSNARTDSYRGDVASYAPCTDSVLRQYLAEGPGANGTNAFERQVAMADRIVINKCDLAAPAEVDGLEARLGAINGMADVLRATRCSLTPDALLHLEAFAERDMDIPAHWRNVNLAGDADAMRGAPHDVCAWLGAAAASRLNTTHVA
jgi:G3E family GTPase